MPPSCYDQEGQALTRSYQRGAFHVKQESGFVFASLACGPIGDILANFLWGLVIYVMSTAVANEFGIGKAMLAVILPILVIPLVGPVRLLDDLLPY